MNEPDVFVLADETLNRVIAQIRDEQWNLEMPATFTMRNHDRVPTLREVVNYHAYDDAWVPDTLSGETMDEVGRDKFDGDLLGDDPKASFAASCTSPSVTTRRGSTSGRSTRSGRCVPMTSRRCSASIPSCPTISYRESGTR